VAYDEARSKRLAADGFRVLRFPNREMNRNFDGVLDGIVLALGIPMT
jgi:very-short-patch-repair endonuclease